MFEEISKSADVSNYSAVKRYFDRLYGFSDPYGFSMFSSAASIRENVYVAETTNKVKRLTDYRMMSLNSEITQALDIICYAAQVPDENN